MSHCYISDNFLCYLPLTFFEFPYLKDMLLPLTDLYKYSPDTSHPITQQQILLPPSITACGQPKKTVSVFIEHMGLFQVCNLRQWRRQLWGTGARAPLDFQQFHF